MIPGAVKSVQYTVYSGSTTHVNGEFYTLNLADGKTLVLAVNTELKTYFMLISGKSETLGSYSCQSGPEALAVLKKLAGN